MLNKGDVYYYAYATMESSEGDAVRYDAGTNPSLLPSNIKAHPDPSSPSRTHTFCPAVNETSSSPCRIILVIKKGKPKYDC